MKKGLIIYQKEDIKKNQWFIDQFLKEMNDAALSLKCLSEEEVFDYLNNHHIDYVIYRGRNYLFSEQLERRGIRVFNNSQVNKTANNKLLSYDFAKENDIKSVETYLDPSLIKDRPFIMKSVSGHGGQEVFLINDLKEIAIIKEKYPSLSFIYQDYLKNDGDLRLYILNHQFIGGVLRFNKDDYRNNYSLGASAKLFNPPKEVVDIAIKISHLLEADYIGVDFLKINEQYFFLEIEDPVGARMLYQLSDIDIIKQYAAYIKSHF